MESTSLAVIEVGRWVEVATMESTSLVVIEVGRWVEVEEEADEAVEGRGLLW